MSKTNGFTLLSIAFILLGGGALLAGCGSGASGGDAGQNQAAKQQFLAERGGGTPGVMTNTFTYGGGPGGQGGPPPGVVGSVDGINGSTITVKNPMDNSVTSVHVADGAKLHKQQDVALAEIKQGDKITATGQMNGDTLEAMIVQLGGGGAGGGMAGPGQAVFFNSSVGPGEAPGGKVITSGDAPVQAPKEGWPQTVSGTVGKVEGNKITIKAEDGSTTVVQPNDNANITRQAEAQLSDLQAGDIVSASGSQKGDTFEATDVTILGKSPARK